MTDDDYQGGLIFRDPQGNRSGHLGVRSSGRHVHLSVTMSIHNGAVSQDVAISATEAREIAFALKEAAGRIDGRDLEPVAPIGGEGAA